MASVLGNRNHILADNLLIVFINMNSLPNVRVLAYEHSIIPQRREDSYVVALKVESSTVW